MLEKVVEILSNFTQNEVETVTEETRLVADMGLSSLDVVNIVMEFEDEFDIEIPDDAISKLVTVGDIIDLINMVV